MALSPLTSATTIVNTVQAQDGKTYLVADNGSIYNENGFAVSQDSLETCTDGKDDGKIGFWSGVGNFFKGVGKGIVNGIKGMFTDANGNFSILKTLKTVVTVAACFIPVVGPYIGAGLCAIGAVKGGIGIGKSIYAAATADTDAEAKDALQSLGGNTLATGLSVAGLKGSLGAIAKQSGFTSFAGKDGMLRSAFKSGGLKEVGTKMARPFSDVYGKAWSDGLSSANSAGIGRYIKGSWEVLKVGGKGTVQNMAAAARAAGQKMSQTFRKITGKEGSGTAEQIANSLSTKNNTITAEEVQNALNNGGTIKVGNRTYQITQGKGNTYNFSLQKPQVKVEYSPSELTENNLVENSSLDNIDTSALSKRQIAKIEKLSVGESVKTKIGEITKTGENMFSFKGLNESFKTVTYNNVSMDELGKILGKDSAAYISERIDFNNCTNAGSQDFTVNGVGKGNCQYLYEANGDLTVYKPVSNSTAKFGQLVQKGYTNGFTTTKVNGVDVATVTPWSVVGDVVDEMESR